VAVEYKLIVIGVSAGGLTALTAVLQALPADFPVPIAIVQHRARESDALAAVLQDSTKLRVCEIEDKMSFAGGGAYIAPPDYHVHVDGTDFSLSVDELVAYARPSIDVLFESAADEFGKHLIGVVLTGANADGSHGLRRIADRGGYTIVQDPATAEVPYMPRFAREAVPESEVLTLSAIPVRLRQLTQRAAKGDAA
jgi:two-component system chemotaxis response regulator CheB